MAFGNYLKIIKKRYRFNFRKSYYKQFNNILQAINLLKNNELFCIKYNLYEGRSICTIANEKIEYLVPCIEIKEKDLKSKIELENIVKRKLTNVQSVCPLCGYDENKKIISQTYFKIFNNFEVHNLYL